MTIIERKIFGRCFGPVVTACRKARGVKDIMKKLAAKARGGIVLLFLFSIVLCHMFYMFF